MPVYETVFMARQDLTESQVKDLTEKYSDVLKEQGGKLLKTEQWGLRTLAYKINKAKKAHYTLVEFESEANAPIELERLLGLDEDIMRSLTIKLDEATDGPSPVMRKSNDDDYKSKDKKEAA